MRKMLFFEMYVIDVGNWRRAQSGGHSFNFIIIIFIIKNEGDHITNQYHMSLGIYFVQC